MKLNKRRGFKHSGRGHRKHKSGSRGGTGRAGHRTHKAMPLQRVSKKSRYINYQYILTHWSDFESKNYVATQGNQKIIFSGKFKAKIINIPQNSIKILGSNRSNYKPTNLENNAKD